MKNRGQNAIKAFSVHLRAAKILFILLPLCLVLSCLTSKTQEKRLTPRRSADDIRMDDIRNQLAGNPVKAIDLIGIYRAIYGINAERNNTEGIAGTLLVLEKDAIENLRSLQEKAVREERWEDAASLNRSLAGLGVKLENPDLVLSDAKKKLSDGNDLGAFLAAVQAHELSPLTFDDALLFLKRAVEMKQRRTAAFFLAVANNSGDSFIPPELREYAQGRDSAGDMIRGVATVIVDRGVRIERGRGIPDRVLGSAFFVDSSGLLITNYHVISSEVDPQYRGYSRMYIRMGDSSSILHLAKVVGWDKAMDLALIKADYKPDFVFSVVDRMIPHVGDTVLAMGSPGGLEKTVTSGIVSNLNRRFLQIGDVIQIDAAVNHGNSGGPVVDSSGRLVGIVFAGIEQYQGLNFAVPAERLAAALPAMIRGGKAERPWLGLALNETSRGAEIIYIAPNTPAAEHRISEGDLIKTINGRQINAPQGLLIPALQDAIFQSRSGELVVLETSGPESKEIKRHILMTVKRPDLPLSEAAKVDSKERIAAPLFGMVLAPSQGRSFSSTYQVKKVIRGSIADEAGISDQDPVSIHGLRIMEKDGYALMDIDVKKRRLGYLEFSMRLPALLDSPDTL